MSGNFTLRFLGTGSATSSTLGSASAVLERAQLPILLIDCGPTTLGRYQAQYHSLPPALFITHTHLDHIGGLENLFYSAYFTKSRPVLFVPAAIVPLLFTRLGEFPGLAEGGANFFDAFQLVPVGSQFFWHGLRFDVFPVRHHVPQTSYGMALAGVFLFSGDTRPIPEVIAHYGSRGETVFHDCAMTGSPSHSGAEDLLREYPATVLQRTWLYHQHDHLEAQQLRAAGLSVLEPGAVIELPG